MGRGGKQIKNKGLRHIGLDDERITSTIDELAQFEEFRENILKSVREDLAKGLSAKQIREKYAPMVEARKVSIALADRNPMAALSAAKDLTDRVEGKPTERSEITHRMESLEDEQLDALIRSDLEQLKGTDVNH